MAVALTMRRGTERTPAAQWWLVAICIIAAILGAALIITLAVYNWRRRHHTDEDERAESARSQEAGAGEDNGGKAFGGDEKKALADSPPPLRLRRIGTLQQFSSSSAYYNSSPLSSPRANAGPSNNNGNTNTQQHSSAVFTPSLTSARALASTALRSLVSAVPHGLGWSAAVVAFIILTVAIALLAATYYDSFESVAAWDLVIVEYRPSLSSSSSSPPTPPSGSSFSACTAPSDPTNPSPLSLARPFRISRIGADGALRRAEAIAGVAAEDSDASVPSASATVAGRVLVGDAAAVASSPLFAAAICDASSGVASLSSARFSRSAEDPSAESLDASELMAGVCYTLFPSPPPSSVGPPLDAITDPPPSGPPPAVAFQFLCVGRDASDALFDAAHTSPTSSTSSTNAETDPRAVSGVTINVHSPSSSPPEEKAVVLIPPHATAAYAAATSFEGGERTSVVAVPNTDGSFGDEAVDVYFRGAGDGSGYPHSPLDGSAAPADTPAPTGAAAFGHRGRFAMPRALPSCLGRSYAVIPKDGLALPQSDPSQPWNIKGGGAVPFEYYPRKGSGGGTAPTQPEAPAALSQEGANMAPFAFSFSGDGSDALRYYGLKGSALDASGRGEAEEGSSFTLTLWVRLSPSANGLVFAVADAYETITREGSSGGGSSPSSFVRNPIVDAVSAASASGRATSDFRFDLWRLYMGLYADGPAGRLRLVSSRAAGVADASSQTAAESTLFERTRPASADPLLSRNALKSPVFEHEWQTAETKSLFNDKWHFLAIAISIGGGGGSDGAPSSAQLFIDGRTSYSEREWHVCLPTRVEGSAANSDEDDDASSNARGVNGSPLLRYDGFAPIARLPPTCPVRNATFFADASSVATSVTPSVRQGGVLVIGGVKGSVNDLRVFKGRLRHEQVVALGAPSMAEELPINAKASRALGAFLFAWAAAGLLWALLLLIAREKGLSAGEFVSHFLCCARVQWRGSGRLPFGSPMSSPATSPRGEGPMTSPSKSTPHLQQHNEHQQTFLPAQHTLNEPSDANNATTAVVAVGTTPNKAERRRADNNAAADDSKGCPSMNSDAADDNADADGAFSDAEEDAAPNFISDSPTKDGTAMVVRRPQRRQQTQQQRHVLVADPNNNNSGAIGEGDLLLAATVAAAPLSAGTTVLAAPTEGAAMFGGGVDDADGGGLDGDGGVVPLLAAHLTGQRTNDGGGYGSSGIYKQISAAMAAADEDDKEAGFAAPEVDASGGGFGGGGGVAAPTAMGSGSVGNTLLDFVTPLLGVTQAIGIYFAAWRWPQEFTQYMDWVVTWIAVDLRIAFPDISAMAMPALQVAAAIAAACLLLVFLMRDDAVFEESAEGIVAVPAPSAAVGRDIPVWFTGTVSVPAPAVAAKNTAMEGRNFYENVTAATDQRQRVLATYFRFAFGPTAVLTPTAASVAPSASTEQKDTAVGNNGAYSVRIADCTAVREVLAAYSASYFSGGLAGQAAASAPLPRIGRRARRHQASVGGGEEASAGSGARVVTFDALALEEEDSISTDANNGPKKAAAPACDKEGRVYAFSHIIYADGDRAVATITATSPVAKALFPQPMQLELSCARDPSAAPQCPCHGLALIEAVPSLHFAARDPNKQSPYACAYADPDAEGLATMRVVAEMDANDKKKKKNQKKDGEEAVEVGACPGVSDAFFVCPDDSCSFCLCPGCYASLVPKLKGKAGAQLYSFYKFGVWPYVGVLVIIVAQSVYLPVTKAALMVLACHPSYWCIFPSCWEEPSATFAAFAALAVAVCIIVGIGMVCLFAVLLQRRWGLAMRRALAEAVGGWEYGTEAAHRARERLWEELLQRDRSLLRALYNAYSYDGMRAYPFVLLFRLALLVPAVFAPPDSLSQIGAISAVEGAQLLFWLIYNPFAKHWIGFLTHVSGVHQVAQLALACFSRAAIREDPTSTAYAAAMWWLFIAYLFIFAMVTMVTVVFPIVHSLIVPNPVRGATRRLAALLARAHALEVLYASLPSGRGDASEVAGEEEDTHLRSIIKGDTAIAEAVAAERAMARWTDEVRRLLPPTDHLSVARSAFLDAVGAPTPADVCKDGASAADGPFPDGGCGVARPHFAPRQLPRHLYAEDLAARPLTAVIDTEVLVIQHVIAKGNTYSGLWPSSRRRRLAVLAEVNPTLSLLERELRAEERFLSEVWHLMADPSFLAACYTKEADAIVAATATEGEEGELNSPPPLRGGTQTLAALVADMRATIHHRRQMLSSSAAASKSSQEEGASSISKQNQMSGSDGAASARFYAALDTIYRRVIPRGMLETFAILRTLDMRATMQRKRNVHDAPDGSATSSIYFPNHLCLAHFAVLRGDVALLRRLRAEGCSMTHRIAASSIAEAAAVVLGQASSASATTSAAPVGTESTKGGDDANDDSGVDGPAQGLTPLHVATDMAVVLYLATECPEVDVNARASVAFADDTAAAAPDDEKEDKGSSSGRSAALLTPLQAMVLRCANEEELRAEANASSVGAFSSLRRRLEELAVIEAFTSIGHANKKREGEKKGGDEGTEEDGASAPSGPALPPHRIVDWDLSSTIGTALIIAVRKRRWDIAALLCGDRMFTLGPRMRKNMLEAYCKLPLTPPPTPPPFPPPNGDSGGNGGADDDDGAKSDAASEESEIGNIDYDNDECFYLFPIPPPAFRRPADALTQSSVTAAAVDGDGGGENDASATAAATATATAAFEKRLVREFPDLAEVDRIIASFPNWREASRLKGGDDGAEGKKKEDDKKKRGTKEKSGDAATTATTRFPPLIVDHGKEANTNVNCTGLGRSPLATAVAERSRTMLGFFIGRFVDLVTAADFSGNCPSHLAAANGDLVSLTRLLWMFFGPYAAQLTAKNSDGESAIAVGIRKAGGVLMNSDEYAALLKRLRAAALREGVDALWTSYESLEAEPAIKPSRRKKAKSAEGVAEDEQADDEEERYKRWLQIHARLMTTAAAMEEANYDEEGIDGDPRLDTIVPYFLHTPPESADAQAVCDLLIGYQYQIDAPPVEYAMPPEGQPRFLPRSYVDEEGNKRKFRGSVNRADDKAPLSIEWRREKRRTTSAARAQPCIPSNSKMPPRVHRDLLCHPFYVAAYAGDVPFVVFLLTRVGGDTKGKSPMLAPVACEDGPARAMPLDGMAHVAEADPLTEYFGISEAAAAAPIDAHFALCLAAANGHTAVVRILLAHISTCSSGEGALFDVSAAKTKDADPSHKSQEVGQCDAMPEDAAVAQVLGDEANAPLAPTVAAEPLRRDHLAEETPSRILLPYGMSAIEHAALYGHVEAACALLTAYGDEDVQNASVHSQEAVLRSALRFACVGPRGRAEGSYVSHDVRSHGWLAEGTGDTVCVVKPLALRALVSEPAGPFLETAASVLPPSAAIARLLLTQRPKTASDDVSSNGPLYVAIRGGNVGAVRELLRSRIAPLLSGDKKEKEKNVCVSRLVAALNEPCGADGATPLALACHSNEPTIVSLILGALLEAVRLLPFEEDKGNTTKSTDFTTALTSDAAALREEVLRQAAVAVVGCAAFGGHPPLYIAAASGFGAVINVLVDFIGLVCDRSEAAGADPNTVAAFATVAMNAPNSANHNFTPLYAAAQSGKTDAVRALLRPPMGSFARLNYEEAPSAHTISNGASSVAGTVLPAAVTGYFSPLRAACSNGHADVAQLLLEAGADPFMFDASLGHTRSALHYAVARGHLAVVTRLLGWARWADDSADASTADHQSIPAHATFVPFSQRPPTTNSAAEKKSPPAHLLLRLVNRLGGATVPIRHNVDTRDASARDFEVGSASALNVSGAADERAYYAFINNPRVNGASLACPLGLAAATRRADIAAALLAVEGIDVELGGHPSRGGTTPLFEACRAIRWDNVEDEPVVTMLLAAGADPCLASGVDFISPLAHLIQDTRRNMTDVLFAAMQKDLVKNKDEAADNVEDSDALHVAVAARQHLTVRRPLTALAERVSFDELSGQFRFGEAFELFGLPITYLAPLPKSNNDARGGQKGVPITTVTEFALYNLRNAIAPEGRRTTRRLPVASRLSLPIRDGRTPLHLAYAEAGNSEEYMRRTREPLLAMGVSPIIRSVGLTGEGEEGCDVALAEAARNAMWPPTPLVPTKVADPLLCGHPPAVGLPIPPAAAVIPPPASKSLLLYELMEKWAEAEAEWETDRAERERLRTMNTSPLLSSTVAAIAAPTADVSMVPVIAAVREVMGERPDPEPDFAPLPMMCGPFGP